LLAQLADSRAADEELHRRGASLVERTESRDPVVVSKCCIGSNAGTAR